MSERTGHVLQEYIDCEKEREVLRQSYEQAAADKSRAVRRMYEEADKNKALREENDILTGEVLALKQALKARQEQWERVPWDDISEAVDGHGDAQVRLSEWFIANAPQPEEPQP